MRLFENKKEYGLGKSEDIADLLNRDTGNNYDESTYRKFWTAFNQGREYEKSQYQIGVANRILALSDFHFPFQLPVSTYEDYRNKVDVLILNGDLLDCQSISRFPKAYRIPVMEELINGREYFIELIEYINPQKVLVTDGNHDVRIGSYLSKKLDTDLLELMPNSANEFLFEDGFTHYNKRVGSKTKYDPISKLFDNIEVVYTGDWKVKVGKTWFNHPFAFSSGTLKTCERAMTHFFKTDRDQFDLVCLAHTHRTAHSKNGFVNLYEQGSCCNTSKMLYTSGRLSDPQKEGFLYVCQDKEGNVIESKTKLIYLN